MNCSIDSQKEFGVEVGKCAFDQTLILYEAADTPAELQWLIAHLHAKLAILAGYENEWRTSISQNNQAIKMLEDLPPNIAEVNQIWVARYWARIASAHTVLDETRDAIDAYNNAIRIGEGQVDG